MHKFALTAGIVLLGATAVAAQDDSAPSIAPPSCDYGSPHPNAPAELAQFDFLIGDYTITSHAWQNGAWTPPRPGPAPRWNGRYILGGMAIEDEWFDVDPGLQPDTTSGVNIRMWDAKAGEWDMMWLHSAQNQVYDLRAGMVDGKLTMWNGNPKTPAYDAYFERLGPDSWERVGFRTAKDGSRTPTFKLVATRIPCDD